MYLFEFLYSFIIVEFMYSVFLTINFITIISKHLFCYIDLMIFIGRVVQMRCQSWSALPVMAGYKYDFDEVGAPACLSGGPSAATNIPLVYSLLKAVQSTF